MHIYVRTVYGIESCLMDRVRNCRLNQTLNAGGDLNVRTIKLLKKWVKRRTTRGDLGLMPT